MRGSVSAVRRVAVVSGHVQGVGYRYFVRGLAGAAGLTGSARNLPDGRVEMVAEGTAEAVDAFVAWARIGPPRADVTRVTIEGESPSGARGFYAR